MKRRLLALLVTALVLCTMAVTTFADYTSEWITTRNWVQDTSVDSTTSVKITVTVAREDTSIQVPMGSIFFTVTRINTSTTDSTHGTIGELYQECYIEYSDLSTVFQSYTMYVSGITSGTGSYIEITLGKEYSEGSTGLKSGIRWRYTIEEITTTDDGYQDGYNAGYAEGDTAGYNRGYAEGDTAGYNRGYAEGDTAGYNRGYTVGYNAGVASGGNTGSYQDGYNAGYEVGYSAGDVIGYDRGYAEGYSQGQVDADPQGEYAQGFADGKAEGQADAGIALNFMDGFFTSLTGFFTPFLSIGIGPLTIGGMLALMVIAVIVIVIVKVVRG